MAKKVKSSVYMVDFIIGKFLEKSKMKNGYSLLLTKELNGNELFIFEIFTFFFFIYSFIVTMFLYRLKIDFENLYKRLNRTVSQYTFSQLFRRINCNQRQILQTR